MLPPRNTHSPIAQLLSKHLVSSMSQSELSYYPYHQVLHSTPGLKHYMSALRQGKLVSPPRNTHRPIVQLLSKHLVSSMSQIILIPCQQVLLHSTPGLKDYMSALRQGKLVLPPRNTHRPIVQLLSKHLVSSMSQIILIPCQQVLLHSTPGLKDYMSALRQGKLVLPPRNTHRPIVQLLSKHSSFLLCPTRASSQYNPYTISTSTVLKPEEEL